MSIKPDKRPRRSEAFLSGGSRIRTGDPMLAKHVLYQLSYTPFDTGKIPRTPAALLLQHFKGLTSFTQVPAPPAA